ncbi:MAG TPA: class I SAM-dependent methyltransferase [Candidatus Diapherotrites archaeon]|uniref:Class I SAM-dependent methyltransferase n=1 Tax=Candidatus Iainarchaeum sp. TaxID=3101447 RepID=A0A7J4JWM4_9ARCH|nr:class I SAM-dependent methyltransferase [Candidatus Diapherotrites archaeon]
MQIEFFDKIYDSWKPKQLEKFEQLLPILKPFIRSSHSLLDLGIGRAWFESFLLDRSIRLSRIVGADINQFLVSPRLSWVQYEFSKNFQTQEKFDWVVCFDSLHLLQDKNVLKFLKPKGIALISLPVSLMHEIPKFENSEILHEGFIGVQEKDYFQLLQSK